jgi:capsular exopolysaccharide synthesis family protein
MRNLQLATGQMIPSAYGGRTNATVVVVPSMVNPMVAPWEELDRDKRRLQGEMRQLETSYGRGHPKMVDLRKQVEKLNRALDLELEVAAQRFELQYANLKQRRGELEGRLPEVQVATRQYEQNVQKLREIGLNRSAWDALQEQMTRLVTALGFWADKQRVELQFMGLLDHPDGPVAPNRIKIALVTLLLGLALAISVPFLFHYLDNRLSNPEDAELILELDALGLIPEIHVKSAGANGSSLRLEEQSLAENFRMLRTNLLLRSPVEEPTQVILVSSALSGEGKTMVAANIAKSFAKKGELTLLIDADLYRGCLHRHFEARSRPGLSEALRRQVSFAETCVAVGENLELIPRGERGRLNSELVDSSYFAENLKALRSKYKRIIIDSPPILGLSEVSLLQRHTDGILIVVSGKSTPRQAVLDAVNTLRANGGKINGFVLNRADFSSLAYRYRYYYYTEEYYSKYAEVPAGPAGGEAG